MKFLASGPDLPLRADGRVDELYRRARLRVMLAITLGYGIAYTCRLAINVVKKPLIDNGIFSPIELGLIGSALFYSYAVGKLINGFIADHVNVKRFLALGILLSALANIGMGFSTVLWVSAVLWGLNGWLQSVGAPTCVVAMTHWFSNRERGRRYGIWSIAHSLGEGLTFAVVAAAAGLLGWRFGFWVPGVICIGIALWVYLFMADRPQTMGLPPVAAWRDDRAGPASARETSVLRTQLSILKIPGVWILALASAANYIVRYAINSWGVLYLQEARGFSLAAAGTMLTLSTFAGMAGAVGYGYISDKVFAARRPPVNLIFGLVELAGMLLIFFGPANVATLITGLLLFGFGMTGLVTSLGGLFAVDICPKRVAGAVMGLIGIFSYLGAAVQESVSGWLIERGMIVHGATRTYDFGPAICFWIASSIIATLLAAILWNAKLRD